MTDTAPAAPAVTAAAPTAEDDTVADEEIEEMQKKVQEMEEEAEKLKKLTEGTDEAVDDSIAEADKRSVYVGNVDYGGSPEELQEHFKACGAINRITIMVDKFTGQPKGFAYMEFADEASIQNAVLLSDSLFRGRQLKVTPKRTNIPGFNMPKGKGKGKGKGRGKGDVGKGMVYPWAGYPPYKGKFGKGKSYFSPY
mmetsp:Transcript_22365/g.48823  ORF Transcript_22365/g.48823 Transcript_22365/m.48823 type:complete len:196 (+) Transcript_22365:68-655(+)